MTLIIAGAAAWTPPIALTAAEVLRTSITVRVYQTVGLSPTLEQRALAEAEMLLGAAFVDVVWRRCTGPRPSATCDEPLRPSELSLRILKEGEPADDRPAALGNAFVDRRAGGGVLATVYFNQVARLATLAGTDVAVVLGRAAAHELGHLIMRTSVHRQRGLMRPNWTAGEVRRNRASDWTFTAVDVAAIRRPAEPTALRAESTR